MRGARGFDGRPRGARGLHDRPPSDLDSAEQSATGNRSASEEAGLQARASHELEEPSAREQPSDVGLFVVPNLATGLPDKEADYPNQSNGQGLNLSEAVFESWL